MFKIVETADGLPAKPPGAVSAELALQSGLPNFCVSEDWSADLEQGVITVGDWTMALHGLASARCGLMSLARGYDAADRRHIIGLFEQAAAAPSSFCYSSTILLGEGRSQPMFCMAHSLRGEDEAGLLLKGVFLYPRFKLEAMLEPAYLRPLARSA